MASWIYQVSFVGLENIRAKLDRKQFTKLLERDRVADPNAMIAAVDRGEVYRNDWLTVEKPNDQLMQLSPAGGRSFSI